MAEAAIPWPSVEREAVAKNPVKHAIVLLVEDSWLFFLPQGYAQEQHFLPG
jgi:hypothetical protein